MNDDPTIPAGLKDDLPRIFRNDPVIPDRIDQVILKQARVHAARTRRWWLARGAIAAAAMVMLAVGGWIVLQRSETAPVIASVEDFNGDGTIDVRDVLGLARRIESGNAERKYDLNGDGVVDQGDVDAVAFAAVRLPAENVQ